MRKRQYGSVRKRGIAGWALGRIRDSRARNERKANRPPDPVGYIIPAGTRCHARKHKGEWEPHVTQAEELVRRYTWRNRTHHGFLVGALELKVENSRLRFI